MNQLSFSNELRAYYRLLWDTMNRISNHKDRLLLLSLLECVRTDQQFELFCKNIRRYATTGNLLSRDAWFIVDDIEQAYSRFFGNKS